MTCPDGPQYIFQKINTAIFPDPDALMENITREETDLRVAYAKSQENAHTNQTTEE